MGRVFKALDLRRQEAQDRHPYVAVKLLSDSFRQHPASFISLQREAKKSQSLSHPNIIKVFDFDRDGGTIYMTMEYLSGRTLDSIIKAPVFSGIHLKKAMEIIRPVAEALAYAHKKGIVHCDLKPSNVFIMDDGQEKVIDFGIARAVKRKDVAETDVTVFDAGLLQALSPPYASPEMIEGEDPDPRDDIYALACITYELLSGQHPFNRRSALIARKSGRQPPKLPHLTSRQWSALKRGLALNRDERTPTVESFVHDLAPVDTSKNWHLLAAGAAVSSVLVGGVVWFSSRSAIDTHSARGESEIVANSRSNDVREQAPKPQGQQTNSPAPVSPAVAPQEGGPPAPGAANSPPHGAPEREAMAGQPPSQGEALPRAGGQAQEENKEQEQGTTLRDCSECPEMVAVAPGNFLMGAPESDPDAEPGEKPQRAVGIEKPFAISNYEITFEEWEACASDGGCHGVPDDSGWGRGSRPVINVSWNDAQDYLKWLQKTTGQRYRLPTEAEWEYAARAGTTTRYPWGEQIGENNANCNGCGSSWDNQQTAPVGSFSPNAFGLYDMVGNVWQWVEDCQNPHGETTKADSRPRNERTRCQRVVRGGSWANSPGALRVSQRLIGPATAREDNIGFRVVRDLP